MDNAEIEELARRIQLICLARRRMRFTGDQEGVDIVNRYLEWCEKIQPRMDEILEAAERSLVGYGSSFPIKQLTQLKVALRARLEGDE